MSLNTIIRNRTEEKELRLSGDLVMSKEEWLERGGIYRGSLGTASKQGYFTVRVCEKIKQPVTEEELKHAKDFAMFKSCYQNNCLRRNGKDVRPCLPVFYREAKK